MLLATNLIKNDIDLQNNNFTRALNRVLNELVYKRQNTTTLIGSDILNMLQIDSIHWISIQVGIKARKKTSL